VINEERIEVHDYQYLVLLKAGSWSNLLFSPIALYVLVSLCPMANLLYFIVTSTGPYWTA
jgi:hypothetical protein